MLKATPKATPYVLGILHARTHAHIMKLCAFRHAIRIAAPIAAAVVAAIDVPVGPTVWVKLAVLLTLLN